MSIGINLREEGYKYDEDVVYKGRDGLEANDNWKTPSYIYDPLDDEFHFDFDPCPLNHDMSWDGLEVEWGQSNFVNPPYNKKDKPKWIEKAYAEWKEGKTVVMLLPSSTGTEHFHKYIYRQAEIRFVKGRISFEGYNTKGQFTKTGKGKHDSMIVIFRAGWKYKK